MHRFNTMSENKKIEAIGIKLSFAAAEEHEGEYYAHITWKESAENVEKMRQSIWSKEYLLPRSKKIFIAHLNDDRDDVE